ncbi:MAG: hypothetical protein LBR33_03405 [Propionibacteriaceae bacterium]|jgi:hydrogenase small subunit|nr:hypothetical protein [Propionibacteriaceae bacterium]
MTTAVWLQGGACGGNTAAVLGAADPALADLAECGVEWLWHPALAPATGAAAEAVLAACADGTTPLDLLVFEGAVIQGPDGTGRFDQLAGRPVRDWLADLAGQARFVVAVGTCAAFGGLAALDPGPAAPTGLQFQRDAKGGCLGAGWRSSEGFPVINLAGCPVHPDIVLGVLLALATGRAGDLALDQFGRPRTYFTSFAHTGCPRQSYNEFKQAASAFGEGTRGGCLFAELGCRGPMTHAACNRLLWNGQSSKTRAGTPCLGCTEPDFPAAGLAPGTVFRTRTLSGAIPREVPAGEDHVTYLARSAAARVAAPEWAKADMFVV